MLYIKALHIIFVVTWFAALFYMPRLLIYNTEAGQRSEEARNILRTQFTVMMKRLWFGIAWPSAVITLILGALVVWKGGWIYHFAMHKWLHLKLGFVFFLYLYHLSLHILLKQQLRGAFKYSSQQLRVWNEVATVFLVAIVMLVVVKQRMSMVWGIAGLLLFVLLLMSAVRIYKSIRK